MYHVLVVDDEPLIGQGVSRLLAASGLPIGRVHLAFDAYEALDCIRLEEIDLCITDIQMGEVSGLDLIRQARLIKPWLQTIVISAHEMFQYAQTAVRLGVKDYLVKPLNEEQLLVSVRNTLLRSSQPGPLSGPVAGAVSGDAAEPPGAPGPGSSGSSFRMAEPTSELGELLRALMEPDAPPATWARLEQASGMRLDGPDYAVICAELDFGETHAAHDAELLRYAALNIAEEVLHGELSHVAAYTAQDEIAILLQWSDPPSAQPADPPPADPSGKPSAQPSAAPADPLAGAARPGKLDELDMYGRSLQHNLHTYLKLECWIGISQVMRERSHAAKLFEQARLALTCRRDYPDHAVFYFGDFAWSLLQDEAASEEGRREWNNRIVEQAKASIEADYRQKGLTLNEVARRNHVSPNYLSYLFKKHTGLNLWEYVVRLRMEESKRLLEQTDLRRYEIAERIGYESPEHFSKVFKKHFGFSPSEWKRKAP
ncbi:response regulator [Paenibacillus sp. IB182496]|uniref:Response regulator n=1 Tax=Paenibacillus sabuli TaxID=2772509 RepID=A0A927GUE8_9BACL|nr:helix-turn-helix domain-containing protein [Paenibacillus sabuli]MBD2848598.1 response regulator [Paenibacillus sabuli]